MAEEVKQENQTPQAEFAFLVVKQKDGRLAIASVNTEMDRQPNMEDIAAALLALSNDLERQQLVSSIIAGMQQVSEAQTRASGLVVPEKRFVKRGK